MQNRCIHVESAISPTSANASAESQSDTQEPNSPASVLRISSYTVI